MKRLSILIVALIALVAMALSLTAGTFAHASEGHDTSVYAEDVVVVVGPPTVDFSQTFGWTITKTATPDFHDLTAGGSGSSHYVITVAKDKGTYAATLDGKICVTNNDGDTPPGNTLQNVQVAASLFDNTLPANLTPVPVLLVGPTSIAADGLTIACYPYHFDIPASSAQSNESFTIGATVTATNLVKGPVTSDVDTTLPSAPRLINDTIHVSDNFNNLTYGPLSTSQTVAQYDRTFTCPKDAGITNNTATIVETGVSASASVAVDCPGLPTVTPVPTKTPTPVTPGLPNTGSDPNA